MPHLGDDLIASSSSSEVVVSDDDWSSCSDFTEETVTQEAFQLLQEQIAATGLQLAQVGPPPTAAAVSSSKQSAQQLCMLLRAAAARAILCQYMQQVLTDDPADPLIGVRARAITLAQLQWLAVGQCRITDFTDATTQRYLDHTADEQFVWTCTAQEDMWWRQIKEEWQEFSERVFSLHDEQQVLLVNPAAVPDDHPIKQQLVVSWSQWQRAYEQQQ